MRYSQRPFPTYRFIPGQSPHPRRDALGHSHGQPEPTCLNVLAERWFESEDYLFAVDLYNHGFWWESHEVLEALWHAAGHKTPEGEFYRALIQFAAASLKRFVGKSAPAQRLLQRGCERLSKLPRQYMGLDVTAFSEAARISFSESSGPPAAIRLAWPPRTLPDH